MVIVMSELSGAVLMGVGAARSSGCGLVHCAAVQQCCHARSVVSLMRRIFGASEEFLLSGRTAGHAHHVLWRPLDNTRGKRRPVIGASTDKNKVSAAECVLSSRRRCGTNHAFFQMSAGERRRELNMQRTSSTHIFHQFSEHARLTTCFDALSSRNGARHKDFYCRGLASDGSQADSGANAGGRSNDMCPVERLRKVMRDVDGGKGIDAYIVPSEDPHQSEYSAESFARREFISGFSGSAGTVVITPDKAALWTDGRYFLQAEKQLNAKWTLMRAGQPGVPGINEWLRDNLLVGARVGIDPFLHSAKAAKELSEVLSEKRISLVPLDFNLVDVVWEDRPKVPVGLLHVHPIKFAGVDVPTKLQNIRKELLEVDATALVVTMLDEVAWLLNLRGRDVPHCPVAIAYVVVDLESAILFVDGRKITSDVRTHLSQSGVVLRPYEDVVPYMRQLAAGGARVWMDPAQVSAAMMKACNDGCDDNQKKVKAKGKRKGKSKRMQENERGEGDGSVVGFGERASAGQTGSTLIFKTSPVSIAKAVKNDAELNGIRAAHLRDAAALVQFFTWLEGTILREGRSPTEFEVGLKLEAFRSEQHGFLDTSFETIAGSGSNGAIIHYRAEEGSCGVVDSTRLFLLDSGGQYEDGTTDITRTMHFGVPSEREKECFTRVLQGHIALDTAVFPEGIPGFVLDAYARRSLWQIGLDFRHGTGHGVGAALNVHEGPQGISPRFGNLTGLVAGMVVSNEPGYYEDGSFGIRIENLLAIRESATPNRFGGVTFLEFEKLTFVPMQTSLLNFSLMNDEEIQWVNTYHQAVWDKVSPLVSGDALEWLRKSTAVISKKPSTAKDKLAAEAPEPARAG